jgi:trans-aconitate methyltransferase
MPASSGSTQQHWEDVYAQTDVEETGWFEASPGVSLSLVDRCDLEPADPIVDIGAGASSLAASLLERGQRDISVLDISQNALDELQSRLGSERAAQIQFIRADVTEPGLRARVGPVQLWHDRAMLHFLTTDADCSSYARVLEATVAPGGYAILATYALDGAPT